MDCSNKKDQNKEMGEIVFKKLITDVGFSEKSADELWKWYDNSKMKGVASF
jgi:hypothetical protein